MSNALDATMSQSYGSFPPKGSRPSLAVLNQAKAQQENKRGWRTPVLLALVGFAGVALTASRSSMRSVTDPVLAEQGAHANSLANASLSKANSTESAVTTLKSDDEHTRITGRPIGDGLYKKHIVQVLKPTRLYLSTGEEAHWFVNGAAVSGGASASVEFTFTTTGSHDVTALLLSGAKLSFEVVSKIVRKELRDLSGTERTAYFDALAKMYFIDEVEAKHKYGSEFFSAARLVKIHLDGAAARDCDHWHDDAGMLNHHIGITKLFEKSMRMIDPTTAAHYWDYTREEVLYDNWWDSIIFDDDWYGSNSPDDADHAVNKGRFAYTPIMENAHNYSNIINPYGLLRSPWNTNPVPYLLRSNRTMSIYADADSTFPPCNCFGKYVGQSLAEVSTGLNGNLHGPVHIMIGGMWYEDRSEWHKAVEKFSFPDAFLLLSKVLWRTGYLREPASCSKDTPVSECLTKCPEELMMGWNATQFLDKTGMKKLMPEKQFKDMYEAGITDEEIVNELCHIGFPGEMFSSAAPQDPTFWPLHGNAERFVQLLRILDNEGLITFDQTWSYTHKTHLPSDDHLVCDWSGIDPQSMEMPNCTSSICTGHAADDLLPFEKLIEGQTQKFTNMEFWEAISPIDGVMDYAFDSLDYWLACTNSSMYAEYSYQMKSSKGMLPVGNQAPPSRLSDVLSPM